MFRTRDGRFTLERKSPTLIEVRHHGFTGWVGLELGIDVTHPFACTP